MRKWIELCEDVSRVPPTLYHGTSGRALIRIMAHGLLGSEDDGGGEGVFCSEHEATSWEYVSDHMYDCPDGGVIVLSVASLRGWLIDPYRYHETPDEEEFVIRGEPISSDRFVEIRMRRPHHDHIMSSPLDFYVEDEWDSADAFEDAWRAFCEYPNIKII